MAIDLSGVNTLKFDVYASRMGSNLKFGIHDTGGEIAEITPDITTANTWQTIVADISSIPDEDKDAIDTFTITVVNADAANTFYVDNFTSGTDEDFDATALELTASLKAPVASISVSYNPSVLALVAAVKDITYRSSVTVGDGALTLELFNPNIKIDSSYTTSTQTLALVLEGGAPFVETRIIRRTYTFGVTEQVTVTKLNNFVDTAVWEISNQTSGDLFYLDGTTWTRLAKGTAGQMLTMGASFPEWK
jgi:hypothetical protein